MARKLREEDYCEELVKSYEHWRDLYLHGGQDPFWEDGCNLNLVRNHIIYYKTKIEENLHPSEYPPEYFSPLPPKINNKYMARKEEIRANAINTLKTYKSDESYIRLKSIYDSGVLNAKEMKALSIGNILNYVTGLETYIEDDSLVDMRRHEYPERYIKSFKECLKKVTNLLNEKENDPIAMLYGSYAMYDEEDEEEPEM